MRHQLSNATGFEIKNKNVADQVGFRVVRGQLACLKLVSQRYRTAHPHSFLLRSGDFVPDAFSRDFPFELCEGKQNIQRQPTHRGRGVELLGNGDERHFPGVEGFNDLCKIREATGQSIYLIHNDNIDSLGLDVFQQTLQRWSLHCSTGVSSVVIASGQSPPAFMPLAEDESLASLSLCIERVE